MKALWPFLLSALLLCFGPDPSWAIPNTTEEIQQARALFENGQYKTSLEILKQFFDSYQAKTFEDMVEAHTLAGAAYYLLPNPLQARVHFESLLNFKPDITLDPRYYSPKVIAFLNGIKNERIRQSPSLGPDNTSNPLPPSTLTKQEDSLTDISNTSQPDNSSHAQIFPVLKNEKRSETDSDWKIAYQFIPFGTGQFINGDKTKGALYLTTELAALGVAVTSLALYYSHDERDNASRNTSWCRDAFFVSLFTLTSITTVGVIDALIGYEN